MSKLLVFSNPVAGREDEFNDWYDNVHLKDLLAIPGVTSAERFSFAPLGAGDTSEYAYLAVYQIDGDLGEVLAELGARSADGRNTMSDSLDAQRVLFKAWEPIAPAQQ
jgi:hypothetical protein